MQPHLWQEDWFESVHYPLQSVPLRPQPASVHYCTEHDGDVLERPPKRVCAVIDEFVQASKLVEELIEDHELSEDSRGLGRVRGFEILGYDAEEEAFEELGVGE